MNNKEFYILYFILQIKEVMRQDVDLAHVRD